MTIPQQIAATQLENVEDFSTWVGPHLAAMTRLAARLAPDTESDDVVQEALVRAWQKRRQYDPARGMPLVWLLAITADQARKARGRSRKRMPITELVTQWRPTDDQIDLENAVSRLAGRQRLAVDCYYFVGLSVAETAGVMQCSEGTVKSTLADARLRLRTILELGR